MSYSQVLRNTKQTPQTQPIPGRENEMKVNNAGGVTFVVDKWTLLERFLILGSDKPTYYVKDTLKFTEQHRKNVVECLRENAKLTIDTIVNISSSGRAIKNEPALFAMAICLDPGVVVDSRDRKYAAENVYKVARTGTHLFTFVEFATKLRGWGELLKYAVSKWYTSKDLGNLTYSMLKYQQRNGWSQRDILRLVHPKPHDNQESAMYKYFTKSELDERYAPALLKAYEKCKVAEDSRTICGLIEQFNLSREMVPTKFLTNKDVQAALLQHMPMTAMVRNLGNFSATGLLSPLSEASKFVVNQLTNTDKLRRSKIHPMQVLLAYDTYKSGRGKLGSNTWMVNQNIVDALLDAFYASFANVTPTGQNYLLGLDVSGSMSAKFLGTNFSHAEITAAMALLIARVEKNSMIFGFAKDFKDLQISSKDTLETAFKKVRGHNFGPTDCAVPMLYATNNKIPVDNFVVMTDNETWAGSIQPSQAMKDYRRALNPKAKLAVIATAATEFTVADPKDAGMLDVVGFDANVPVILRNFFAGPEIDSFGPEENLE